MRIKIKTIVLTCKSELESAQKLGYETTDYLNGNVEKYAKDLILRWGQGYAYLNQFGSPADFPNVITGYETIEGNCNKKESNKKLSEVVTTPKLWEKHVPRRVLAVYRPNAHAAGKDFQVKKGSFDIEPNHYATEFIKSDREVRVWYCNGRTMCARRVTKNKNKLNEEFKCRSLWSYKFWKKTPRGLHKQVLKAAKHLGFQYGAFDILITKGKYYFLENNTAPSLDHSKVIKFYKRGLKSIIKRKIKQIRAEWRKNPPFEVKFNVIDYKAGEEVMKQFNFFGEEATPVKAIGHNKNLHVNNWFFEPVPLVKENQNIPKKEGGFWNKFIPWQKVNV